MKPLDGNKPLFLGHPVYVLKIKRSVKTTYPVWWIIDNKQFEMMKLLFETCFTLLKDNSLDNESILVKIPRRKKVC